jgi:alpha-tubulin suppressor-like RCC1 family protein
MALLTTRKLPFLSVAPFLEKNALMGLFLWLGMSAQAQPSTAGTALHFFNGANSYVQVPGFGNVAPTSEITIEFWQRVAALQPQSTFSLTPDADTNRINAHVPFTDGVVYWDFGDIGTQGRLSYTPPVPTVGTWQHFAFVASQSGNYMAIYRNGVLETNRIGMTPFVPYNASLSLGAFVDGGGLFFGGDLDEVRIWNVARSQSDIQSTLHKTLVGNEPGLVAYWRLDEASGTNTADATGNGNNGTLTNGPSWVISTAPIGRPYTTPPVVTLNGANPFTNQCHAAFFDPGTTASTSPVALAAGDNHSLALDADGTVTGWGYNLDGEINISASVSNVVALAAGSIFTLALKSDGTVAGYGDNSAGQILAPGNATNVVSIAAGGFHSLALKADGTVVAWGDDTYGESDVPVSVTNALAIAAGSNFSLALRADGTVVGWGDNSSGETSVPPSASNVLALAAGNLHGLALRADGTVVGWGNNTFGQTNVPVNATNVIAVAARGNHSLALRADGRVIGWGDDTYGQSDIPASVTNVVAIAAGTNHSLALKADGTVVGWGDNTYGQTSNPTNFGSTPVFVTGLVNVNIPGTNQVTYTAVTPFGNSASATRTVVVPDPTVPVITLNGARRLTNECHSAFTDSGVVATACPLNIAAGGSSSLALLASGSVTAWGDNTYGETNVPANATNVIALAAGAYHVLAVTMGGTVIGWGANFSDDLNIPASATNAVAVAAGDTHSLALKSDGTVVAWGDGSNGKTTVPASATNVIAISAGANHSLALRLDGTVLAWGLNSSSQCHIAKNVTNIVGIAAGGDYSLALKSDGTVLAWGNNTFGQLNIPASATNVVALAAGQRYGLARRADGTAVGLGTSAPGLLPSLTNLTAVAVGTSHNLVLKADGTVLDSANTVPANLNAFGVTTNGTVNPNMPGTYQLNYATATNEFGASASVTRTVVVVDTLPPSLTLVGANLMSLVTGGSFVDPGATANDVCAGNLTGSILVSGSVNTAVPGTYTLLYAVSDPSGNVATTNRTVWVTPSELVLPTGPASMRGAVNPNGLDTTVYFQYGLTTSYGATTTPQDIGSGSSLVSFNAPLAYLLPGTTYHYRIVSSNSNGTTYGPDLTFTTSPYLIPGDLNGDGIVDQSELNTVLSNYWPYSPWLSITDTFGLGTTNILFSLTNANNFDLSVLVSTNLTDWENLGPAHQRYQFFDPAATNAPQRYYRLRWP